ncbi:MAG: hypothetical protein ACLTMG_05885 [Oscillospiraceae bacterium]
MEKRLPRQNQKRYTDKNAAINTWTGGRKPIPIYSRKFPRQFPKEYERHFMVHGTLLPGYTVEGLEQTKTEHAAAEVSEGGIFTPQNQRSLPSWGGSLWQKPRKKRQPLPVWQ